MMFATFSGTCTDIAAKVAVFVPKRVMVISIAWAVWVGVSLMDTAPLQFAPQTLDIEGMVYAPAKRTAGGSWRFDVKVETVKSASHALRQGLIGHNLRLYWYGDNAEKTTKPLPNLGERWQFTARLRPAVSQQNEGGFDYERWLKAHDIQATGSIKRAERIADSANLLTRWRRHLLARVNAHIPPSNARALIKALALGDKSEISPRQWDTFRHTGTVHLLAISGLHVGMMAGLAAWLAMFVWRHIGRPLRISAPSVGWLAAVIVAGGYAVLSGFAIPVQRAFFMLALLAASRWAARHVPPFAGLWLAFMAVSAPWPRVMLQTGFWLSFLAVFVMLLVVERKDGAWLNAQDAADAPQKSQQQNHTQKHNRRWLRPVVAFARVQVALALGLLPLGLYFFQHYPSVGALVNAWMVPLVTLLILPWVLLLVAVPLFFTLPWLTWVMAHMEAALHWAASLNWHISLPSPQLSLAVIATLFMLLAVWAWRNQARRRLSVGLVIGALLLVLPWQRAIPIGEVRASVLDVGQGLAVAIHTRHHTVLYDTGRENMADWVILPYLTQRQRRATRVVISHGDSDHRAGLEVIQSAFPRAVVNENCEGRWRYDEVLFVFRTLSGQTGRNNQSCILHIESADGAVLLLTGDIERAAEQAFIKAYANAYEHNPVDVLLMPHHGSKTSSSPAFLALLAPKAAVVSAGYQNHFGHPHPSVTARYGNIPLYNTACLGQLDIALTARADIRAHRQTPLC